MVSSGVIPAGDKVFRRRRLVRGRGQAATQVLVFRNLLLSLACLVFDPEVGHEGEAADLAAEAAEPFGRGLVRIVEEVVGSGVAADRDAVELTDTDFALVALPTGVEFATKGVGLAALDVDPLGTCSAGLPRTDRAVRCGRQLAAGEGAGPEAGSGPQD